MSPSPTSSHARARPGARTSGSGPPASPARVGLLLVGLLLLLSGPASAQEATGEENARPDALAVFIDCQTWPCDTRYFRTEIAFVNWVRVREEADVHVIVTGQDTGGGGEEFLLDFVGRGDLEGTEDQLTFSSSRTATEDEMLAGITRTLSIGLARYAALAGYAGGIRVRGEELTEEEALARPAPGLQGDVDDPWDFWVFRVGADGRMSGEERQSSWRLGGRLSADRTTRRWKISSVVFGNWRESTFELDDTTTFVDSSRSWMARSRVVYSLADRWSLATEALGSASTFRNQDRGVHVGGGVEYSFFPYAEATRRRLTATYLFFVRYNEYEEETIFDQLSETLPQHRMEVALDFRQPWGEAGVGIDASQYLHDTSKNRLALDGDLEFRIYRGLSLDLAGRVAWIRDQLFIPKEEASEEDILRERRRLSTDFDYRLSMGFDLSFGSIYNNVVNNRFRGGF